MHEPLVDFARLDLTRVIAGPSQIGEACMQRGRMALLDGILHFDEAGMSSVGFKEVRTSDWWAADHIPGRPLFPGALMCEAAAQLSTYDFMTRRRKQGLPPIFVGFGGMEKVRFRATVVPDCRLVLACKVRRIREKLFTYATQGFVEHKLVFEAEILGVVV
jgi:3-hydroxyacyl-[acyl-carrier-protein] dehydratase